MAARALSAGAFSGAVLAGGRSRRMGSDKAFVRSGGRPLADVARLALVEAGAAEVLSVGGDRRRLGGLGFTAIADETPDAGPLAGVLAALEAASCDWVAVLSCDLPRASAATVAELLAHTGDGVDVVVPLLAGRSQHTHAVWRRDCRTQLRHAFAAGERRLGAALAGLRVRRVAVSDPASLRDADTPGDVPDADLHGAAREAS